jgi:hypothetical protein
MIVSVIHAEPTVMIPKIHVIITPSKKSAVSGVISCLLFYAFLKWDCFVICHRVDLEFVPAFNADAGWVLPADASSGVQLCRPQHGGAAAAWAKNGRAGVFVHLAQAFFSAGSILHRTPRIHLG